MNLKKWISYLIPFTEKIESQKNGTLELTYINGKKVLDTQNTNYSYGKLQGVMEFGLEKVPLKKCKSFLILGMGGGCVIKSLRDKFNYSQKITAVDYDAVILNIAKEEYHIKPNKNTTIVHKDAFDFVANTTNKFDVIVIDLFEDNKVIPQTFATEFWKQLNEITKENARIIFNAGFENTTNDNLETLKQDIDSYFYTTIYQKVKNLNTMLIAEKRSL